jgi:wyosine [tRNA(Phe)-imidazoG37] synthetase (radical SAM superfamily)
MKKITQNYITNFYSDICVPNPTTLNVEVTNICNLRCVMCPTHSVKRAKGFMDLALYKDILLEAVDLGIKQIGLHTVGESILHPEIVAFIEESKKTGLYTFMDVNGNLIREGDHERIIDAGLDSLKFSIDAHNTEIYKKVRIGGNFENVFDNLKKIDEIRKRKKANMRLYALYLINAINEKYFFDFKKKIGKYVDDIEVSLVMNQGEQVEAYEELSLVSNRLTKLIEKHKKKIICPNPWKRINISWDGYLTGCCIDFELNMVYGKYEPGNLKELWNNKKINDIRNKVKNFDLDDLVLCRNCDMIHNDVPNFRKELNEMF